MDDNPPVHRAHTVDSYKDKNKVTSTEWPEQSPDLSGSTHMKRAWATKVCGKYRHKKNDLLREIQSAWRNIKLDYINKKPLPFHTWPPRQCMKMNGHLTKY